MFRKNMRASKWFGRGGIKATLVRHSILGDMQGKWNMLKDKCTESLQPPGDCGSGSGPRASEGEGGEGGGERDEDETNRAQLHLPFTEGTTQEGGGVNEDGRGDQEGGGGEENGGDASPRGVDGGSEDNAVPFETFEDCLRAFISDIQWDLFQAAYLKDEAQGYTKSGSDHVLYVKLCDDCERRNLSLAHLGTKEFSDALRHGLKMASLTSEEVQLLSGNTGDRPWWNQIHSTVDVDKFESAFLKEYLSNDLTFFKVLLVQNVWPDILRALDSLKTTNDTSLVTMATFEAGLEQLVAHSVLSHHEKVVILDKVKADKLIQKDGAFAGYMKNVLMHYIPNEIALHKIVYPHWEDSAEKFKRFALSDKIELNYRQVCFVVGMSFFCGRIR